MDIQANIESGYLQDATLGESRQIVKRTIKDSVFTKNPNVWIFRKHAVFNGSLHDLSRFP